MISMMYLRIILLLIPLGFVYDEVLYKLVLEWWNDPNYSHGFLVPVFSGYILWQKKEDLRKAYGTENKSFAGLLIMIIGLIVLFMGKVAAEQYMQRFSIIIVIIGITHLLWGHKVLKECLPALGFLVFMIPIPYMLYDAIAFPLRLFAAKCATTSLTLLDIPVFREGNIIYLANTTLELADACSGIRSLFSLLAVGTVLAYVMLQSNVKRIILVLLVIPIAVFANSIRVIATGILAYFYGSWVAEGFFHGFSGLLIFVVALIMLMIAGKAISTGSKIKKSKE